jgi:Holliday junction resolvasome RuvABC endonuclease subunit
MSKLLALDLGLSFTGWSLFLDDNLVNCGCIHNPEQTNVKTKQLATFYKSQYLYSKLSDLITTTAVKSIICEMPTGGSKSAIALSSMSMSNAVLASLVMQYQLTLYKVTPRRIKTITCNNSKATKDDMMNQIKYLYPSLPKIPKKYFEHIADSIGAFLTYKSNCFTEVPNVFA